MQYVAVNRGMSGHVTAVMSSQGAARCASDWRVLAVQSWLSRSSFGAERSVMAVKARLVGLVVLRHSRARLVVAWQSRSVADGNGVIRWRMVSQSS